MANPTGCDTNKIFDRINKQLGLNKFIHSLVLILQWVVSEPFNKLNDDRY